MATMTGIRAWIAAHRAQSQALGLAVLGLVVFTTLGLRARKEGEPLRAELAKLHAAQSEASTFRTAFKSSSPEQDLRVAHLSDSLSVAIPREQRVALAQRLAADADAVGLSDVRVRFTTPDSGAAPARPDLVRSPVTTADYSIAIECYGGFADVLSFVNHLPASVAVQRIVGADVGARARFQIALAVFEAAPAPAPVAAGGAVPNPGLSHLTAFAEAVSDAIPVAVADEPVALRRDPFATRTPAPAVKLGFDVTGATMDTTTRAKIVQPKWHVSAILIGGAQRAAIINDVLVRVGDTLPGGTKLTSVEQDRVVLTESNGTAHTVAVREGEG